MCNICNQKSNYRESLRVHGRPPRKFFICLHCTAEVQGTYNPDGSVHEFPAPKSRGGSTVITLRLSDAQLEAFLHLGKTSREIFELGLETYKSSQKYLKSTL